jgi:hypothetical protein
MLKVGTVIMYRPMFNTGTPIKATITRIEATERPHTKYGTPVAAIPFASKNYCIIDLDNNHWAYGEAIVSIVK